MLELFLTTKHPFLKKNFFFTEVDSHMIKKK